MEEKTKELKRIEDLEETHDDEIPTKKLDTISEEEILNEEVIEEETEPVIEEKVEETTPPVEQKEKKKMSKKKLFIIIGISAAVLIILLIVLLLLLKPKKEETPKEEKIKYTEYGEAISKSLEKGDLDKVIKENLEKNKIKANTVTLLNIDIDSDNRQDLVVFASENNNKVLLNLNVKDDVSYEESYKLDSKESIGYLFSGIDNNFYWYVEDNKKFTPIDKHSTAKDIEENKETLEYILITTKYKNENIIEYGLKYNFDKKLDIKELEEKAITNKDMQSDINMTKESAKKKLDDDKEALVKKNKEEAEKERKEKAEQFKKDFPEEKAKKVVQVALTNFMAVDTRDDEGEFDTSKFHDSTYDGEYKLTVTNEGEWEVDAYSIVNWIGKNISFKTENDQITVTSCEIIISDSNYKITSMKFTDSNGEHNVYILGADDIKKNPYLLVSQSLIK